MYTRLTYRTEDHLGQTISMLSLGDVAANRSRSAPLNVVTKPRATEERRDRRGRFEAEPERELRRLLRGIGSERARQHEPPWRTPLTVKR